MLKNTNNLNGWVVIDKPQGMGSTPVVSRLKRLLSPSRIGHAGTLDPMATGVLPIALGYATKLIPLVMDGTKIYEFQVTWGQETDTDDATGTVIQTSEQRPSAADILAMLPRLTGTIEQMPPAYSALKINGRRAYDLARTGQDVALKARSVRIDSLSLLQQEKNTADFRVVCGKGTYVRSLGRDMGRLLGCLGYVSVLRRVACGPFQMADAVELSALEHHPEQFILPVEKALGNCPRLTPPLPLVHRLCQGQRLSLATVQMYLSEDVGDGEVVLLYANQQLVGMVQIKGQTVQPYRIFQSDFSTVG